MSQLNQRIRSALIVAAVGGIAVTAAIARPPVVHHFGTDIIHFFERTSMTNEGVVANATGRVDAKQNTQGHADNQNLDITVQNLSNSAPYQLLALVDDDTNYTQIGEFTTDAKGRATVSYRKVGSSHGHSNLGHGRLALPAAVDPVSHLREVAVAVDTNTLVLRADLTSPDSLQYLIKRDISSNSVAALLRIHSNGNRTQFQLQAFGLDATNDYWLVLNGGVVQTNTSDSKGRLNIKSALQVPTEILDLRSVALWDTSSNVVVSTTLP